MQGIREDAGYCLRLELPPRERKAVPLRGWGGWRMQLLAADWLSELRPLRRIPPELLIDAESECGTIELLREDRHGYAARVGTVHPLIFPCSGACEGLVVPVTP